MKQCIPLVVPAAALELALNVVNCILVLVVQGSPELAGEVGQVVLLHIGGDADGKLNKGKEEEKGKVDIEDDLTREIDEIPTSGFWDFTLFSTMAPQQPSIAMSMTKMPMTMMPLASVVDVRALI